MQRERVPERRRGERERAASRARLHERNSEKRSIRGSKGARGVVRY